MALGFGFNKQKALAAAEKAVQQGKLQNAISEYEKVVKEDAKDLNILNTIGDLYARVGNNEKASYYFKRVGDIYASEGFTVKAIAVYKKIAKLNPGANESVLKLAELYTQQGLYNDARQQYIVIADQHMKSGSLEEAAQIFQKILELDSENTAMQSKLADLYLKLGRKNDARNIFLKAAQSLYQRGALDAADESLRRVISLDPENTDALLLRGRIAGDAGDSASAIQYLEKIPQLEQHPDALKTLLQAHIQTHKFDRAEVLAHQLLSLHNDASGMVSYAQNLLEAGSVEAALKLYNSYADKLLAVNPASIVETLLSNMNRVADNVPALELMRGIFVKAGEHSRINEVSEALAHAYVQAGAMQKAADIYHELSELEPENPLHLQNFKQIQSLLGKDPTVRQVSKEEGEQALMVEELEHQAPALQQSYPEPVRDTIKAALTEAELFESYSMPMKALAPLEAVLPKAPEDVQVNQRLVSLYARSGRLQEAIQRCAVLQKVYAEAGFENQAKQYAEMATKYEKRIHAAAQTAAEDIDASFMPGGEAPMAPPPSATPADAGAPALSAAAEPAPAVSADDLAAGAAPAMSEFAIQTAPSAPSISDAALEATAQQAAGGAGAHEIDLTDWEQMTSIETPEQPKVQVAEMVEETQFYINQKLWKEAGESLAKLEAQAPDAEALPILRANFEAAQAAFRAAPAGVASVAEFTFDVPPPEPVVEAPPPPAAEAAQVEEFQVAAPPPPAVPVGEPAAEAAAPVKEPPKPVAAPAPPARPTPAAAPAPAPAPVAQKKEDMLADFVLDLDESLGEDFAISTKTPPKPAAAPAPPKVVPVPAPPKAVPVPPPPPAAKPAAPAMSAAAPSVKVAAPAVNSFAHPEASSTLSDIFEEFKEDMEESADQAEDPDTHYNLGVAFKEMGLLDEAIGELQKVCQAIEHGHPFTQVMQAYTWLAHCFLEKGAPEASVKWYEKALHVPAIDEESKLAVYYELGAAHEAAGNMKAALASFNEVYSTNIDYRDVAERIKSLKG